MACCKKKKRLRRAAWMLAHVLLVTVLACVMYVNDYYHADTVAIEAFAPGSAVRMQEDDNGNLVFTPESPRAGFIFYPGGKVEYTAYTPLMEAIASEGFLCVLVEMPCNLAVLDMNAADGIRQQHPQIENWYIGGHSLGGSMAASYVAENADFFRGLVLLGAYSTADLRDTGLQVLSLYGSEDLVMNREKYETCKANLPEDFTEIVIDGGCHAFFGMYGAQEGDGIPAISNEEQIYLTADALAQLDRAA